MSRRRGTNRERQVREQLERDGWVVARSAGSRGCADLMASRVRVAHFPEVRVIQVKSDQGNPYTHFGPYERRELVRTAEQAGGEAWLVWWPPDRKGPRWIAPGQWPKERLAA